MAQKKAAKNGKGAGEPKKAKTKAASANGSSSKSTPKNGSGLALLGCVVIAVVSFAAGVFTPPVLSLKSAYETQRR